MPQILFECSDNLIEKDLKSFLHQTHLILCEGLPTKMESCKSKVVRYKDYLVGDGQTDNAFINLAIGILPGRSDEIKKAVINTLQPVLNQAFSESKKRLNLQVTLSIYDLPVTYTKLE